jgi:hypothetical protein
MKNHQVILGKEKDLMVKWQEYEIKWKKQEIHNL